MLTFTGPLSAAAWPPEPAAVPPPLAPQAESKDAASIVALTPRMIFLLIFKVINPFYLFRFETADINLSGMNIPDN